MIDKKDNLDSKNENISTGAFSQWSKSLANSDATNEYSIDNNTQNLSPNVDNSNANVENSNANNAANLDFKNQSKQAIHNILFGNGSNVDNSNVENAKAANAEPISVVDLEEPNSDWDEEEYDGQWLLDKLKADEAKHKAEQERIRQEKQAIREMLFGKPNNVENSNANVENSTQNLNANNGADANNANKVENLNSPINGPISQSYNVENSVDNFVANDDLVSGEDNTTYGLDVASDIDGEELENENNTVENSLNSNVNSALNLNANVNNNVENLSNNAFNSTPSPNANVENSVENSSVNEPIINIVNNQMLNQRENNVENSNPNVENSVLNEIIDETNSEVDQAKQTLEQALNEANSQDSNTDNSEDNTEVPLNLELSDNSLEFETSGNALGVKSAKRQPRYKTSGELIKARRELANNRPWFIKNFLRDEYKKNPNSNVETYIKKFENSLSLEQINAINEQQAGREFLKDSDLKAFFKTLYQIDDSSLYSYFRNLEEFRHFASDNWLTEVEPGHIDSSWYKENKHLIFRNDIQIINKDTKEIIALNREQIRDLIIRHLIGNAFIDKKNINLYTGKLNTGNKNDIDKIGNNFLALHEPNSVLHNKLTLTLETGEQATFHFQPAFIRQMIQMSEADRQVELGALQESKMATIAKMREIAKLPSLYGEELQKHLVLQRQEKIRENINNEFKRDIDKEVANYNSQKANELAQSKTELDKLKKAKEEETETMAEHQSREAQAQVASQELADKQKEYSSNAVNYNLEHAGREKEFKAKETQLEEQSKENPNELNNLKNQTEMANEQAKVNTEKVNDLLDKDIINLEAAIKEQKDKLSNPSIVEKLVSKAASPMVLIPLMIVTSAQIGFAVFGIFFLYKNIALKLKHKKLQQHSRDIVNLRQQQKSNELLLDKQIANQLENYQNRVAEIQKNRELSNEELLKLRQNYANEMATLRDNHNKRQQELDSQIKERQEHLDKWQEFLARNSGRDYQDNITKFEKAEQEVSKRSQENIASIERQQKLKMAEFERQKEQKYFKHQNARDGYGQESTITKLEKQLFNSNKLEFANVSEMINKLIIDKTGYYEKQGFNATENERFVKEVVGDKTTRVNRTKNFINNNYEANNEAPRPNLDSSSPNLDSSSPNIVDSKFNSVTDYLMAELKNHKMPEPEPVAITKEEPKDKTKAIVGEPGKKTIGFSTVFKIVDHYKNNLEDNMWGEHTLGRDEQPKSLTTQESEIENSNSR